MRTLLDPSWIVFIGLSVTLTGCDTTRHGAGLADSGDSDDSGRPPRMDGSAGSDAGGSSPGNDGGLFDADGGACAEHVAQCPTPPLGFTRCGGGTIDPEMARTACDSLDPAGDLHVGVTKTCSAFSIRSGHYEVWCGASELYAWASLDMLASSDVMTCSVDVVTYDALSWSLSDTNDQIYFHGTLSGGGSTGGTVRGGAWPFASSDRTTDAAQWTGSLAFDANLELGAGGSGGSGTLFFAPGRVDCRGLPTAGGYTISLAVPITWGS